MSTAQHRSPWAVWKDAGGAPSLFCGWWRSRGGLGSVDRRELAHIAGDLGMTGAELEKLAARGPHAADELRGRMRIIGITSGDVASVARGLMGDLERTCTLCREKTRCGRDLARRPDDPAWAAYCPNAIALTAVKTSARHVAGA
jgi:hypothetical protein